MAQPLQLQLPAISPGSSSRGQRGGGEIPETIHPSNPGDEDGADNNPADVVGSHHCPDPRERP
jgi:hypothetical protein